MFNTNKSVARGVALLDARRPGWESRVNIERLDLASVTQCVLGQLYGHYYRGLGSLNLINGNRYGFCPAPWKSERAATRWAVVIVQRQLAAMQAQLAADKAVAEAEKIVAAADRDMAHV